MTRFNWTRSDDQKGAVRKAEATRLESTRLRAHLNTCVVLINLGWTEGWKEGGFEIDRLLGAVRDLEYAVEEFRARVVTSGPDAYPPHDPEANVKELRKILHAPLELIAIATKELSLAVSPLPVEQLIDELREQEDQLAQRVRGEGAARTFQAACIRARRYVFLAAPGGIIADPAHLWDIPPEGEYPGALSAVGELALLSRTAALSDLRNSTANSPRHRDWASRDPAFRYLLDEKDFQFALLPAGAGATVPFRAPWVVAPMPPSPRHEM